MDQNASKTRDWYLLLPAFIGIILLVQAGSAVNLVVETSSPYHDVFVGTTVTIYVHVYDTDYPGVSFSHDGVGIWVNSNTPTNDNLGGYTNATGWAAITYTPPMAGTYDFYGFSSVNYSAIPGLPNVGIKEKTSHIRMNVTTKHLPFTPLITLAPLVTTTTTTPPTTTPVPLVTTTPAMEQTTPVTQATQVTAAPQTSAAVPALQTDTTPPVTTLTLGGTEDGNGGYTSDVICTLAAADNPGGSGVKVIQYSFDGTNWYTYSQPVSVVKAGLTTLYYRSADNAGNLEVAQVKVIPVSVPGTAPAGTTVPAATATQAGSSSSVPLWLTSLIILIIIAAIGGALYVKSRQK